MEAAKPAAPAKAEQPRLEHGNFNGAEQVRCDWVVTADQGVTIKQIQDPAYWANFGHRMHPWDRIEVRWRDGSRWAELLVLSCGRAYANVKLLRELTLDTVDIEQTRGAMAATKALHQYQWKGPKLKHCILRSDGEILHSGAESKQAAIDWAKNNKVDLTAVVQA